MHKNNFDFLRLVFALSVIITHSVILSGSGLQDPLQYLTSGQFSFSDLGLAGFFTISGYLVFESLKRSNSIFEYYKKRVLRIYPGLLVALIVTMMVGAIVSDLNAKHYFTESLTYKYILLKLSMFLRPNGLPEVFTGNPFPNEANGSLWTIPYEFLFYVLLSSVYFIRNKAHTVLLALGCIYLLAILIYYGKGSIVPGATYYYIDKPFRFFRFDPFFSFGFYFCSGAILTNFKVFLKVYKVQILMMGMLLSVIFVMQNIFVVASHFVLPVLIISFGILQTKWVNNLAVKIGDLSYGIYIYAFLIQQTLVHYFPLNYFELAICTIPLSFLVGYLSWNYIEKPFLKLKSKKTGVTFSLATLAPAENYTRPVKP